MVISVNTPRVIYAAIPKAGCSSVKAMLADLEAVQGLLDNRDYQKSYPTRRLRQAALNDRGNAFKFTVVRDPAKRLMSVYTDRVVDKKDLHKSRLLKTRNLPLDPDPDFFFQKLRRYTKLSSIVHHHVTRSNAFTGDDLGIYDAIYRTSEIARLAEDLKAHTGLNVQNKWKNKSSTTLRIDALKPATREKLRPHLAREYTHLEAYFDNPFA